MEKKLYVCVLCVCARVRACVFLCMCTYARVCECGGGGVYIYTSIYMILDINLCIWVVHTYVVPLFSFLAFLVIFCSVIISIT